MEISTALEWAGRRTVGTLITIRRDGRAQSSDVAYAIVDNRIVVSLTDSRAKTRNIAADPRVVLHVSDPATMSYVSIDGMADLSPVTTRTDDATSDSLVAYFEAVTGGSHPDWEEYRQAMIDEGRLIATITPGSVVGHVNG